MTDMAKDATRVHGSLLAPMERTFLEWMARRLPARVTPDHLTLIGLLATLSAGIAYALSRYWAPWLLVANLFILANWFGDSLDGTLARVRQRLRPRYGFYVDHIVDTLGALFILAGLALSGYMSLAIAAGLLLGFYMLSINLYLAAYSLRIFKLSFWKLGPTELRVLLAIGNVVALDRPYVRVFGERHLFFDVCGSISIAAMLVIFLISSITNTIALYRAERV
jgi:phosphatidylglycerophosphate synthase